MTQELWHAVAAILTVSALATAVVGLLRHAELREQLGRARTERDRAYQTAEDHRQQTLSLRAAVAADWVKQLEVATAEAAALRKEVRLASDRTAQARASATELERRLDAALEAHSESERAAANTVLELTHRLAQADRSLRESAAREEAARADAVEAQRIKNQQTLRLLSAEQRVAQVTADRNGLQTRHQIISSQSLKVRADRDRFLDGWRRAAAAAVGAETCCVRLGGLLDRVRAVTEEWFHDGATSSDADERDRCERHAVKVLSSVLPSPRDLEPRDDGPCGERDRDDPDAPPAAPF